MVVKKKANQRLIASFFAPQNTPEKVTFARTDSRLPQVTLKRSAFEEIGSSDTSFGSPEVTNFRNPVLTRFSSNMAGLPEAKKSQSFNGSDKSMFGNAGNELFVSSDSENEKENVAPKRLMSSPVKRPALKRAASSNVLDILDGQPRRVIKKSQRSNTPPVQASRDGFTLSDEQRAIIRSVVHKGENVFFTGSAGTGKSVVLRLLVQELIRKHGLLNVGVTASTGLAACNIGGQTVHKYLSIGLGTGSPQDLALKIKRNGMAKKRWTSLTVLVVDEISMIDGKLFTKLDEVGKILRNSKQPFGGIQIVCSGDFYQLPPVARDNSSQYCFQSPSWARAMSRTITLTKVFRQKGDNELIDMLNALREGSLKDDMVRRFHSLSRKVSYTDGIEPTELFPTRQEVKRSNEMRLHHLPGDLHTYMAKDNDSDPNMKRLFENLMCEEKLELKEGAQVMYLKNYADNIVVNGSIGTVIGFMSEELWGLTCSVFKTSELIDPSPEFLQIVKLICSLVRKSHFTEEQSAMFNEVPQHWKSMVTKLTHEAFQVADSKELLPVVNFKSSNSFTLILVRREEFSVDPGRMGRLQGMAKPEKLVREQLPLLLAWAMSIHKAQGQSIDRLRVDLRRTFEKGQVYVALSRAINKDHLEVLNFDHRRISVSKDVSDFYKTLTSAVV